jgi:hypothetical protein
MHPNMRLCSSHKKGRETQHDLESFLEVAELASLWLLNICLWNGKGRAEHGYPRPTDSGRSSWPGPV